MMGETCQHAEHAKGPTMSDERSSSNKAATFREEVQRKIQNLLAEFSEGKISRDQFNIIYERYHNQLALASSAGLETDANVDTFLIREATTGKAIGLGVYHHRSGTVVETIGQFDISPDVMAPVLNEFSMSMEAEDWIEPRVVRAAGGLWLVFTARDYTTVITVFQNEPSPQQVRDLERLHHDFERANRRFLAADDVDPSKLGFPFIGFIRKKLK